MFFFFCVFFCFGVFYALNVSSRPTFCLCLLSLLVVACLFVFLLFCFHACLLLCVSASLLRSSVPPLSCFPAFLQTRRRFKKRDQAGSPNEGPRSRYLMKRVR